MPKVSVIIPCYNAERYIVRCLRSLEAQVFKDFEVILIDDCSSDNTTNIIEEYISSTRMTIILLRNKENCGPAATRRRGILASEADFICFCDSDDWYDSVYLLEMIKSQAESLADLVLCSFRFVFDSTKELDRLSIYLKADLEDKHRVLVKAPDSLCLIMVKRSIILSVPYPDMRNGEDMALVPLLIVNSNTISAVNSCMYNYYCRVNSASMMPSMKVIDSLEASFSFIKCHLSSTYQTEMEFIGIRNLLYGALINLFKFTCRPWRAIQILDSFENTFPKWYKNQYIKELPLSKRAFIRSVKNRCWFLAILMSRLHRILLQ